jgi:hypothetical protein
MKVLIIATDIRSFLDLKNVAIELNNQNVEYFFLYNKNIIKYSPIENLNKYFYDTNVEIQPKYVSKTLGTTLPFIPNLLLITNENWYPEKDILLEFKQLGAIIACVENTTWLVGTIKSRLEMLSRMNFPTNCIDIFFENSSWSLETKKICGWYDFKSVIVGNPKYDDINTTVNKDEGILVFGTMEKEARTHVHHLLKQLAYDHKIYYRPHPGEQLKDFQHENIEIISDMEKVPQIASNTKIHMSNISISAYYSVLFNKQFISFDEFIGRSDDLDLNFFKGDEYNFWSPIIQVNSWGEFVNKIGLDRIELLQQRYKILKDNINQYHDSYNFNINSNKTLDYKLFDDFSDKSASKRIVEYIKNISK